MSFGGPTPSLIPPSGPFEDTITKFASSPYVLAFGIFILNIGGRMLPMELTRGQEQFLNQPWFRRIVIFAIFFIATRNLITAIWLSLIVILCIGYLFNENSSLCIFRRGSSSGSTANSVAQGLALTPEENYMLKALTAKAEKIKADSATPIVLAKSSGTNIHDKYQKVLQNLFNK
jgi:hypothetical protein